MTKDTIKFVGGDVDPDAWVTLESGYQIIDMGQDEDGEDNDPLIHFGFKFQTEVSKETIEEGDEIIAYVKWTEYSPDGTAVDNSSAVSCNNYLGFEEDAFVAEYSFDIPFELDTYTYEEYANQADYDSSWFVTDDEASYATETGIFNTETGIVINCLAATYWEETLDEEDYGYFDVVFGAFLYKND